MRILLFLLTWFEFELFVYLNLAKKQREVIQADQTRDSYRAEKIDFCWCWKTEVCQGSDYSLELQLFGF
jgi:hypothetical protein